MTPSKAPIDSHSYPDLSYGQAMLLYGILPIVVVSLVLPLGLTALFLATAAAPLRLAISHGDLFLAGGNASFAGCIVLLAVRSERAQTAAIASAYVLVLLVLPCYALWAYISVDTLTGRSYDQSIAELGGAGWALAGVVIAMACVVFAYRPMRTRQRA